MIARASARIALAAGLVLSLSGQASPPAATAPVELRRIDCGQLVDQDLAPYSDTFALDGRRATFTVPCYLIRHGKTWMLWDAGLPLRYRGADPATNDGATLAQPIEASLARLGLKPQDITLVGVSHYHWDHSGQLPTFPASRLLIGARDWAAIQTADKRPGLDRTFFAPWTQIGSTQTGNTQAGGTVDPVSGDRDVFGDGSVVMLDLPGHSPGHHGLLVRLKDRGPILLTGDLAHTRENYDDNGVPVFNTDRAQTLASFDRFKRIARNLGATVVIEHVPADNDKLPPFPEPAR